MMLETVAFLMFLSYYEQPMCEHSYSSQKHISMLFLYSLLEIEQ